VNAISVPAVTAGELYLADISVPPTVYDAFGMDFGNPFATDPIVRLT
jgi:hypothetical protein